MVPVYYHRSFKRQFKHLPKNIRDKFRIRITIFTSDPYSMELNNHPLTGKWVGRRSIDVTGDIRVVYKMENEVNMFVAIGSHSQLFGK